MASFSSVVKFGDTEITVQSNDFKDIFEAVASIQELDAAMEGEKARLVVRPIKSGRGTFKKYGFINDGGAVLDLGMSQDQDKLIPLFPYRKGSPDYKGFQVWHKDNDSEEHHFSTIFDVMNALGFTQADQSIVRGHAQKCFKDDTILPSKLDKMQLTKLFNYISDFQKAANANSIRTGSF